MVQLTNRSIAPVAGQAAFLPNQPILQGCLVDATEATELKVGAVVTLSQAEDLDEVVIVKAAAQTDKPFGVLVANCIATGFKKGDRVSVFQEGAFVYLPAADANIKRGQQLYFGANGVSATDPTPEATTTYGIIGEAVTQPSVTGDLVVVRIKPGTKTITVG